MNKEKKKVLPKGWNKTDTIRKDPQGMKESIEQITTNEGGKLIGTKNSKEFGKLREVREKTRKTLS